jgi:hypothetical protein
VRLCGSVGLWHCVAEGLWGCAVVGHELARWLACWPDVDLVERAARAARAAVVDQHAHFNMIFCAVTCCTALTCCSQPDAHAITLAATLQCVALQQLRAQLAPHLRVTCWVAVAQSALQTSMAGTCWS